MNRTAQIDGRVSDLTSAELGRFDVGSWFNRMGRKRADSVFSNERIPTLKETLEFLESFKGLLYIEIKCRDSEIERLTHTLCEALEESPLVSRVIVKSFKLKVIPMTRAYCPAVRTAALFAPKIMTILRKEKHLVKIAEEFGADELSLHYSLATRKLMDNAERRNLPVTIWTVDNPRWVKRGMKLGLNAIITNNPARLLAKRDKILKILVMSFCNINS